MSSRLVLLPALSVCLLPLSGAQSGPLHEDPGADRVNAPLQLADWRQTAQEEIARAEYFYSTTADGAYSAPNRSQSLRSRIDEHGLEVFSRDVPESGEGASWKLLLRTVAFGVEGNGRPLGAARLTRFENRIELHRGALSEWFINDERGIEQGWTIPSAPPGPAGADLMLELESRGLRVQIFEDGLSAVFVDEQDDIRLRYSGLRAWDAGGRKLEARMLATPAGLAVRVESENALYPITVDPVLSGPTWTAESNQSDAAFGWSVSGAGDVNDDGFDDVLVGAYRFDSGQNNEGRAFLYLGSASGPSVTADWTAESDQEGALFGFSVSAAGDVNNDGFDDLLIGAPNYDNGETNEGRASLYLGSASGPSLSADWSAESDQANADFGRSVATAGDVNGDGFDDVLIGAPNLDRGETSEGAAFVYLGSASGPSLVHDWSAESDQVNANYGWSVACAGDVNGDTLDDLIVGAPFFDLGSGDEGRAFLYFGTPLGPSANHDWSADGSQAGTFFGFCVATAGNVDGDGFDDVLVGSPLFGSSNQGRALVYLGSSGGPALTPGWTSVGDQATAGHGRSVCAAGDVNADGFGDVLVGAPFYDNPETAEGRASLYLGSILGLSASAAWSEDGEQIATFFGYSVSGAGDVDNDGADDVIIGAYAYDNGELNEGRALLYNGDVFEDCNNNGVDDDDDIANGTSQDCNSNQIPDECDISSGTSLDCNTNGIPDECEVDCNSNGIPDDCDIASGSSLDCNVNGVPDECDLASGTSLDCNTNGIPDECDIASGFSQDCNTNGVPDDCDIASGSSLDCNTNGIPDDCETDCNLNGIPDDCDIASGTSLDCNSNGIPDECELDCNSNGIPDDCDIVSGTSDDCNSNGVPDECETDCNANGIPDECDISSGTSLDCNTNGIPDECEVDCNSNGIPDDCDISSGTSLDCNTNGVPDECEPDCNSNGIPDDCDTASGTSEDCNSNQIPDECEADCNTNSIPDDCDIASGTSLDCNLNGVPDECDLASGTSQDCNLNGIPDECEDDCNQNGLADECDIANGTSLDCNLNGIPDECETDCNANGVPDDCDISSGTSQDCNLNGIPDECEADCNLNGIPDECDISSGTSQDCNLNGVPDECETDCNANGIPDECDLSSGTSQDCNANSIPDECDIASGNSTDVDGNGIPDECEAVGSSYCVTSPNSVGPGSLISALGSTLISDNDFRLISTGSPSGTFGLFFFGPNEVQITFGNGFRCIGGGIWRLQPIAVADGAGVAHRALDFSGSPEDLITPGSTFKFQWWYRDPMGGGAAFNLSDGLSVSFQ